MAKYEKADKDKYRKYVNWRDNSIAEILDRHEPLTSDRSVFMLLEELFNFAYTKGRRWQFAVDNDDKKKKDW